MEEPSIGMLASAAGLSVVVVIITNLVRGVLDPAQFDRWGAVIAVIVGIILALAYVVVTSPVTGEAVLQGILVGLFAGALSQPVNNLIQRARATPPA